MNENNLCSTEVAAITAVVRQLHVMSYLRIALLNVVTHGEFLTSVPALTITYSDVYRILLKRSIVVLKRIFNYYSYQVFSITKDVNFLQSILKLAN